MVSDIRQTAEPGETIASRYTVETLLGRGGMASVYKVRDAQTGATVALKRGQVHDPTKAARRRLSLQREYYTLEQLRHPRIIEVYDYGVDASGPYYTMELLDGADLDSGGRVPWREACALLRDVASSLAILHSRGLLHRDVSPRNVRRTADGRAKLIDFGAMASIGIAVDVAGTPPFIAPEALQAQPLDARADLFSLGALAYFLLSGRHAYPARSISELRDVWRSRPPPLVRIAPEVPPALDALVGQLIALDRSTRPEHAAEVMSRLCAIAGLPSDEHEAVSHAYLKTPNLVGRDAALLAIRKRMLALARGDGGALYVEGVAGAGRSRMLDAAAIEAKLAGAMVVRADGRDAVRGDFGVARALFEQLLRLMPDQAEKARRLARALDGLAFEPDASEPARPSLPVGDESLMLRELRDFILMLCRSQRLVIAVDDADRIDERSAGLLAALGPRAERNPLLLVFAVDRDGRPRRSPALRMLCAGATQVELDELSAEHTEQLLQSVFGARSNLAVVATRIHALARGNPRAAMAFAQHLVDEKRARYEAGRWTLPAYIGENDLPASFSASLSLRLWGLREDARELCETLALADGDSVTLAEYAMLMSHADEARTFIALDELVAAHVLTADAERYAFSRRGYIAVLCDELPAERARAIHARLANWLEAKGGDAARRVHHLFEAGRELEAIELLGRPETRSLTALPLLERAVERALQHGLDTRTILQLRSTIVMKAAHSLATASFWRHAPALLAQIEVDCGLARYRELTDVPESSRLMQALGDTKARREQLEPTARGYEIVEALQELARVSGAFCGLAMAELDGEPIERLPDIDPLLPLSPAMHLMRQRIEIARDWVRGRLAQCVQVYEQMLARLAQPDRGGLDPQRSTEVFLGLNYGIGSIEAVLGSARAEQRAQLLEGTPHTRVIAWVLRHVLALNQGDLQEARRCLRRAELYRLQQGVEGPPPSLGAGSQLLAHARLGNLLGVKSAVDDLDVLSQDHPGWRPVWLLGRGYLSKLQGDARGALVLLEQAVELVQARGHLYFVRIAAAHIETLSELGRDEEALACARAYLERFDAAESGSRDPGFSTAAAMALLRGGEEDRALRLLESAVAQCLRAQCHGVSLGLVYFARAQLAIAAGERSDFERFAELCAEELKRTKNPAMSAKLAALLQEAGERALAPEVHPVHVQELLDMGRSESVYVTLQSRMDECFDAGDRARCALTLLLEHVQGFTGYLYGVFERGARLLAALPEAPGDPAVEAWVGAHVAAERSAEELRTGEGAAAPERRLVDEKGRIFHAILLLGVKDGSEHLAGVFVHEFGPETRLFDRELLATLADALLAHGDVDGAKLSALVTA